MRSLHSLEVTGLRREVKRSPKKTLKEANPRRPSRGLGPALWAEMQGEDGPLEALNMPYVCKCASWVKTDLLGL